MRVVLLSLLLAISGCGTDRYSGFERGFSGWGTEFPKPWSGTIVQSPVRCGEHAARFELRPGDKWWLSGYRAEVNEMLSPAPLGVSLSYAFSTLLPQEWEGGEAVIAQWHAVPDLHLGEVLRSPPLAFRYDGSRLRITMRTTQERVQDANDVPERVMTIFELERDRWHDWHVTVMWSPQAGLLVVRHNGQIFVDYQGPIGYNDAFGPFFKMGIYGKDGPFTRVIYHDEFRRGLAPGPPC